MDPEDKVKQRPGEALEDVLLSKDNAYSMDCEENMRRAATDAGIEAHHTTEHHQEKIDEILGPQDAESKISAPTDYFNGKKRESKRERKRERERMCFST